MPQPPPQFACRPKGNYRWARSPANIAAIRDGRYLDVVPETIEYALTAECEFRCRECTYRASKAFHLPLELHSFATPDNHRTTTLDLARLVIDRATEAGNKASGLLITGGGNPGAAPAFPSVLAYAAKRGLTTAFYDNGTPFGAHDDLADAVVQPENNLAFGRFSINFASPDIGLRFAGVGADALALQIRGVANFLRARERFLSRFRERGVEPPACAVSFICDETNVRDIEPTCRLIADVFTATTRYRGPFDDFVVRPLTHHGRETYNCDDHASETIRELLSVVGKNGSARSLLKKAGLSIKLGFVLGLIDRGDYLTYGAALAAEYATRDRCWTNGLFLTVGPDAKVYFCCDRNLDPAWAVGDLQRDTVREIFHGDARKTLFEQVHAVGCGPAQCEATCRTCRLNHLARSIMSGCLDASTVSHMSRLAAEDPWPLLS